MTPKTALPDPVILASCVPQASIPRPSVTLCSSSCATFCRSLCPYRFGQISSALPERMSIFSDLVSLVKFGAAKISAVEMPLPGQMTAYEAGGISSGVMISPMPSTKPVRPKMKKGTSAPSLSPSSIRALRERPSPKSLLRPMRTVAASELPPPMPAPAGMRFSTWMRTPLLTSKVSMSRRAARTQRSFSTLPITSPVRSTTGSSSLKRSIVSCRSMSVKTDSSRCLPSGRRPTTCRKRLSLAGAGRPSRALSDNMSVLVHGECE